MDKLNKMIAWGQYIHWSDLQYSQFKKLSEGDHESIFMGVRSHWMAAQYVVIEGWKELKFCDEVIDKLLDKYPDYVDIFRRCRNAVYHYQKDILDERILVAMKGEELLYWLLAIKQEFERFLYFYPFIEFGFNSDSVQLSEEYFGCIGWKPESNIHIKKFEAYSLCKDYIEGNQNSKLKKSKENDLVIANQIDALEKIDPDFLFQKLSRIN